MPYVKIDTRILASSLWPQIVQRNVFLTALFMAEPHEILEPEPEIAIGEIKPTGFVVPAGWYGFVQAASVGIIRESGMPEEDGRKALEALAKPDPDSKDPEHEGRRMVRINGGFIILNYDKYRERDYTAALRAKRYRNRKISDKAPSRRDEDPSHRDVTVTSRDAGVTSRDRHVTSRKQKQKQKHSTDSTNVESAPLPPASGGKAGRDAKKPEFYEELREYGLEIGLPVEECQACWDYWESAGWKRKGGPVRDWKATVRLWASNWKKDEARAKASQNRFLKQDGPSLQEQSSRHMSDETKKIVSEFGDPDQESPE